MHPERAPESREADEEMRFGHHTRIPLRRIKSCAFDRQLSYDVSARNGMQSSKSPIRLTKPALISRVLPNSRNDVVHRQLAHIPLTRLCIVL